MDIMDFCGLPVCADPCIQGAFAVKGSQYGRYAAFRESLDKWRYVRYDAPVVREADPDRIEGILLDAHAVARPCDFWSQHRRGGTLGSFLDTAGRIISVRAALDAGVPLDELLRDPELGQCASVYFDMERPDALNVVDVGPGEFLWFQSNGRHRVMAARLAGYRIPVKIEGRMEPADAIGKDWRI